MDIFALRQRDCFRVERVEKEIMRESNSSLSEEVEKVCFDERVGEMEEG